MRRVAVVALMIVISGAWTSPVHAQQYSIPDPPGQSAKIAKKQQKMYRKAAQNQQKAMKKSAKAQRKADKKAAKQATKSTKPSSKPANRNAR
jgi:hypothetical protein